MDYGQLYSKYYSRMSKEGWFKSAVFALIVGFVVNGIIALVTWIVGFDMGLWIALGGLVVVTAAITPVFYFRVFRPTEKKVAKRLDSLGLDERIITMLELQNDTSEIASLQRADTAANVEKADKAEKQNGKRSAFKLPVAAVAAVVCVGVFGIAFSIVAGLSGYGVIDSGKDVWNNAFSTSAEYSVTYVIHGVKEEQEDKESEMTKEQLASYIAYRLAADKSGDSEQETPAYITKGNAEQKVKAGESSGEILYTAKNYYYFVKWLDNYGNVYSYKDGYTPLRHEDNVNYNIKFEAYFDKVSACDDDDDLTRYLSDNHNGGSGGGSGNIPGNINIETNVNDNIIDGNTKYITEYDMYYELAMKYLSDNDSLSAEERAMIETYFDILK
ncbi:MAG: hypothetical protein K2O04_04660 [Clostridiales bacterium]|nr:hypothetical protein [Clostridiales bacterium]